jgi:hypothetical protein
MRLARTAAIGLGAALLAAAPARADDDDDDGDTIVVDDGKPKARPKQDEFKKQDLRGHAVDASNASNVFEKDRFFVDKVDTKKSRRARSCTPRPPTISAPTSAARARSSAGCSPSSGSRPTSATSPGASGTRASTPERAW